MPNPQSTKSIIAPRGFSLVELVVVILIIGILTAVAAPKMFDNSSKARENATRASLAVIRDAIELYKSQNGTYPRATSFTTDLSPFIKGTFPSVQITSANQNNSIAVSTTSPMTASGTAGWIYNESTGDFAVNNTNCINW